MQMIPEMSPILQRWPVGLGESQISLDIAYVVLYRGFTMSLLVQAVLESSKNLIKAR